MLDAEPYEIYARLRKEAPVCWVPAVNLWLVTRWDDCEFVGQHPELFGANVETSPVDRTFGAPTVITCDGEPHKELRKALDPKYRPRTVDQYIDALVRPIANEYLAKFEARQEVELMSEYFEPISTLSLARSLGLMNVEMPTLRRWFYGLAQGATNFECDDEKQKVGDATSKEISAAIAPIFEKLEKEPDDSALSHMLHDGMPKGKTRSRDFILPSIKVTLLGGMQEPGHGAGSILYGLLTNPNQLRDVLNDMDGLLMTAVNEGIRWVAPIGTQTRQTTRAVELGGATIPAHAPVGVLISSACRDETKFDRPEEFDIHRIEQYHAAFGFGRHFCTGHWFARQQVRIALGVLLERFPNLQLINGKCPVFRGWEFRAPTSLWVGLES
jgi:cytochrome P450